MIARITSVAALFAAVFIAAFYLMGDPVPAPPARDEESASGPPPATAERAEAPEGPALWEVSDAPGRLYLFGSFHLLTPGQEWMRPAIQKAFTEGDALVVEINPQEYGPAEMSAAMMGRARLPEDRRLRDILNTEIYQSVRERAKDLGFAPGFFDRFRPWFVGLALTQRVLNEAGYQGQLGVDAHFVKRAGGRDMPIRELETLEAQITALAQSAGEDPNAYMRLFLSQLGESQAFFDKLDDMWAAGDVVGLTDYMAEERERDPAAYRALYVRRNKAWLEKLTAYLKTDRTYFVVVGTGHLVGEGGLVDLLRQRGYAVRRVRE